MKSYLLGTIALSMAVLLPAASQTKPYTVTKTVDTGSHSCTRPGQDYKVYDVAEAPPDRFFVEATVRFDVHSQFGRAGNCVFTNDGDPALSVEKKQVTLKLANGQTVRADVPVKYYLRAYADCYNNINFRLGERIAMECRFSGETDRYE